VGVEEPDGFGDGDTVGVGVGVGEAVSEFLFAAIRASAFGSRST